MLSKKKETDEALTNKQQTSAGVITKEPDVSVGDKIGCHTFRATGITNYLMNDGTLEFAQKLACHESARTTGLNDRRDDEVSLDDIEKINI